MINEDVTALPWARIEELRAEAVRELNESGADVALLDALATTADPDEVTA